MNVRETIQIPCGQAYLMRTHDNWPIECGDVFMSREKELGSRPYNFADFDEPSDFDKRVMTVSTMVGCPCACTFCASRKSFTRNLTAYEMCDQISTMMVEGTKHGRAFNPNDAKEFRVLFTRMGEPMLNVKNVIKACRDLIAAYPHVVIGMSTSGYKDGLDEFLEATDILPHIDMQFSIHSTSQAQRDAMFNSKSNLTLAEIAEYTHKWYAATNRKVGLNFIMFRKREYEFEKLVTLYGFDPDEVWIRLSPWNVIARPQSKFRSLLKTEDVINKKPVSSGELRKAIKSLEKSGITYAYAPAIDEEVKHNVACGQALEAFKGKV